MPWPSHIPLSFIHCVLLIAPPTLCHLCRHACLWSGGDPVGDSGLLTPICVFVFLVLVTLCSLQDLSSLTRDQACAHGSESDESLLLDLQGTPITHLCIPRGSMVFGKQSERNRCSLNTLPVLMMDPKRNSYGLGTKKEITASGTEAVGLA